MFYVFYHKQYVYFGATSNSTQGLLLTLCSMITPGRAEGRWHIQCLICRTISLVSISNILNMKINIIIFLNSTKVINVDILLSILSEAKING